MLGHAGVWLPNRRVLLPMPSAYISIRHDRGEDEVAVEEPLEIRVDGRRWR